LKAFQKIFFGFLLLINSLDGWSQTHVQIVFSHPEGTTEADRTISRLKLDNSHPDSISAVRYFSKLITQLQNAGHLDASLDSVKGTRDTLTGYVFFGDVFTWVRIRQDNLDEGMLTEAGLRDRLYSSKPVTSDAINRINKRILTWCENHGYPFASITYRDFEFDGHDVSALLDLNTEKRITIDSIIVRGTSRLSRIYLENYLSVKSGDLYNESIIRNIPDRVRELPMVTEAKAFGVTFTDETATIILNLEDKKASQIDGVIGILPDYNNQGKVQLTGDIRIRLLSSFGRGELFDFNWKNPQPQTQDLKMNVNYPFLLNSPIGIDLNLGIYKKDTTYIDVNLNAGLQFILHGGNYFKVFVNSKKSNLLSTYGYQNTTTLPPYADISVVSYGIGIKSEKLDYRFNPRRGYAINVTGATGFKTIKENPKLNEVIYDSLDLETVQYHGLLTVDTYISLFSRGVLNLGTQSAGIGGPQLFSNELYRIGGLKTLRGFDEESILTSVYFIGKAEMRYLMDQNSFLFLFFNGAWYERNSNSTYVNDTPYGFGAGITFETRIGIFSVNYALGKEFDNPIRLKAAKVHFGIVNYF